MASSTGCTGILSRSWGSCGRWLNIVRSTYSECCRYAVSSACSSVLPYWGITLSSVSKTGLCPWMWWRTCSSSLFRSAWVTFYDEGGADLFPTDGKLVPAELQSLSWVGKYHDSVTSGPLPHLMALCPHLVVCMGGVQVRCLIDTQGMSVAAASCGQRDVDTVCWLYWVGHWALLSGNSRMWRAGSQRSPWGHQCSGLWYFPIVLAKKKDVRRLSSAERKNSKRRFPPATHRGNLGLTDRGPVVFHHGPCQWVQPDSCHRGG